MIFRRTANSRRTVTSERGAAAVEFALILPILLLLVLGVVEFSRVYNVQISLSNAAREGARYMAIHHVEPPATQDTKEKAIEAAPSIINPTLDEGDVEVSDDCASLESTVTVTINYEVALISGFFDFTTVPLTGKGVMQCGG